jgi:cellulose synthase/poly-beta-1,6-N-acetylglucosamine synthase-like glycosyltransferase
MNPNLSIVIPTMGRAILVRTLESVLATNGADRLEVIVVGEIRDGEVLQEITAITAAHPNVRHISISYPTGDSSRKKNHGVEESRADIVAFLDDDVVIAPDWPEHVLAAFEDPAVGLVSGPSLVPDDINLSARLAGLALTSRAAGYVAERYRIGNAAVRTVGWSRIIGCNAAYRKTVFRQMGGFPPEFYPGEEMIAAWRTQQLGHKLLFIPSAWVYHYPRQSVKRFCRQMGGYGATRIRLKRAGTGFEWTTLIPAVWVFSLVVLGILAPFCGICAFLLKLDLALYALMALIVALETAAQTRRPRDLLVFFMIPVMHLSYGLAEWFEFFRPNRDFSENRKRPGHRFGREDDSF